MGWNIKDSVSNLFEEGEYEFRLESITPGMSKADKPNPVLKFKWACVSDGDYKDKPQFGTFTIRPDTIGILGATLASTQAFEEGEDLPPSDLNHVTEQEMDALARILEARIGGKVFSVKYTHRLDKGTQRIWPNITVLGPSMAAFK